MEKKTLPGRCISKSRLSYAEITKKISKSQWFITTKAYFAFILCSLGIGYSSASYIIFSRTQVNHPPAWILPVLWQKTDAMLKHTVAFIASI